MTTKKDTLTEMEESLCQAFLVTDNKSDALRKSKYKTTGWKPETINTKAVQLFDKVKIKARVAELLEQRSKRTNIDADWMLNRLAAEANADMGDLYNENGGLKPIHEWPEIWRQGLVSGVEVEQKYAYSEGEKVPDGVVTKVKLSDRIKRLELIGRHVDVQAFKDKVEHDVTDKLAETLAKARRRAKQE